MNTDPMPVAVKNSPKSNHKFATFVIKIADCLSGNTNFPNASPSSATFKSLADGLILANAKAKHGGPVAVADRDAKRRDLEHELDALVTYVQGAVKAQATDPDHAATMILSSGLSIKKQVKVTKNPVAARQGEFSGEVFLIARAVARTATYYWEYSLDQKSWTSVPQTMKTRTMAAGLTPGQVYYFRFRAFTRKGLGDYSDVVRLMVI